MDIPSMEKIPRLETLFNIFDGISITSPYKDVFSRQVLVQDVLPKHLNSINCVREKNGCYEGTSTDFFALRKHFNDLKREYGHFRAALLGDGNMSAMTQFILNGMEVEYKVFSRKNGNLDFDTSLEGAFSSDKQVVVINSCSREFVFRGKMPCGAMFWDYNYGMDEHARYWGGNHSYKDGYSLLELQAKYALSFWYD